ncbi:hypothetical protein GP486_003364 [Trichoglossum hirsutum]|uniref:SEC7 domain-containing protein n=1 Tax=Trichoglossum hirsutum TaxID=265104 RepID=A0A9P8LDE7_9PEZI|nr:hypothetical protein GP486_003364 [Trichoglossum hirsutum]
MAEITTPKPTRSDEDAKDDGAHSNPEVSLSVDKEGLGSGRNSMTLRMDDVEAESQDGDTEVERGETGHTALPGDSASDSELNGFRDASAGGTSVPETPTISVQLPEEVGDKGLPPIPAEEHIDDGLESRVQPPDRKSSRHFSHTSRPSTSPEPPQHRSGSQSTAATNGAHSTATLSSMVFVVSALENIAASKEARKRKQLGESVQRALAAIKKSDPHLPDPEVIFEPLQLATSANSIPLVTTALDCIGKLISYSYFCVPSAPDAARTPNTEEEPLLIERAIETICECFQGEATPVEVQLQIIKSLLAAVLNDKIVVHGAGLLKAIRQTYNIFLLSKSSANQQIAQGTLTQMVSTVFERVKTRLAMKDARLSLLKLNRGTENQSEVILNASSSAIDGDGVATEYSADAASEAASTIASESPVKRSAGEKITLQSFENRKSFDDERINENAPTMVTRLKPQKYLRATSGQSQQAATAMEDGDSTAEDEEDEIYIKDAFLVFRAMCKLSIKTLPAEQLLDLKSHGMRSKLLSLHLVHSILKNHMLVFTSPLSTIRSSNSNEPTSFIQAIKQYLCLSLSRNGASSVSRVFEVGCEIFWLMLKNMRDTLKKEIEVFLKEIYFAILDKRNAPVAQKQHLMGVLERLCADPRALVEIYLNYDCDRTALDNMFQRMIEHLSRISSVPVNVTSLQHQLYLEQHQKTPNASSEWQNLGTLPPSLATANINNTQDPESAYPIEYALKHQSLECLVETLRSLVNWSQQGIADATARLQESHSRDSVEDSRESLENSNTHTNISTPKNPNAETSTGSSTPITQFADDPNQLEKAKQRKTALIDGIKQFNYKPKRGIKTLLNEGFIKTDSSEDIARFLLQNDRLDKKMIGEYLGEGEPQNIAIMHAFVDAMDFSKMRFVDALRRFLQSFRLPGEAQKIDRFMLKFAERYITGNPNAFANADTAYVLAYSVIMLNTDQHSSKLKGRRMTKEDFIKNNRGINDSADLPDEYLSGIFDEIASNEIVLDTERDNAAALGLTAQTTGIAANIGQALATVGRDLQREAYVQASEEMSNKTEQLFRSLLRAQRRNASKPSLSRFIPASSFRHVGPMFEVTWMSFLSGLSGQAQDTQDLETIKLCMEGLKLAIRIACLFELDTPRVAFVSALAKFTNLNNISEMMPKNVEALKVLLEVAQTDGNCLGGSWRDVLTCISQLERFQLISGGVDEGFVPDVSQARIVHQERPESASSRKSMQAGRPRKPRSAADNRSGSRSTKYLPDVAQESRSREVIIAVDRIFANTGNLSGDAILHFVRALSEVSWQEIQSSGESESPRTFSLQKLVEISYYNMNRVRFEWAALWQILGEHFNQVGCHTNPTVVYFALDSLRQLSMRFMEIEELPGFKFQKDFLKPFEHVMANSSVVAVKDMVLRCLIQMIQARGDNIRSGWRTMFGVFTVAAREPYEGIVSLAFDNVTQIYNARFGVVISQGAFADLVVCLTEFSKNQKFQKKSLQAIETLKSTIPKMLKTPECPLSRTGDMGNDGLRQTTQSPAKQPVRTTNEEQFWFPVLFSFHDVLMTGDDLEVRSRALTYLFDSLHKYGGDFPPDFWDTLWRQLLYPIFMVLKSKSEMSKVLNHEELSVWLSTTMIQALRNMIVLFTHYFESLEHMLDRFLDLLTLCICQENDTIARIGSNCLQQLILQNVTKFEPEHWTKIVGAFVELFERTTAYQLFSAATSSSGSSFSSNSAKTPIQTDGLLTDLQLTETPVEEGPTVNVGAENSLKINGLPSSGGPAIMAEDMDGADEPAQQATSQGQKQIATELEDYKPQSGIQQQPVVVTAARRRFFNKIITKCVLQLLMIETVNELFSNDTVYARIPSPELLRLMAVLKKSFIFGKKFNGDKELRMRLWREGFMKQPPNLLKQESGSAATYVSILLRMYHDEGAERKRSRSDIEAALIPLCEDIIRSYTLLDEETQQRNIMAWRPVVVDVIEGYTNFPREGFEKHIEKFYPLAVELLCRDLGVDVRLALQGLLRRIGESRMGMAPMTTPTTPTSGASFYGRRTSRGR